MTNQKVVTLIDLLTLRYLLTGREIIRLIVRIRRNKSSWNWKRDYEGRWL